MAFVARRGGFCTRAEALEAVGRGPVDAALAAGALVWLSRGRYALPQLDLNIAVAHGMRATLSHVSAALWHGWEVKSVPSTTDVMLPRRRHLGAPGANVRVHRFDLPSDEIVGGICTSAPRTLLDCLRTCAFDEALVIADSALRHGLDPGLLVEIGARARGPGSPQVRRVAAAASGRAANPFESCLRAIALGVPRLDVQPQVMIEGPSITARPDLVDEQLRIILEADSFQWHGGRRELARDARRYNLLVVDGWMVLRFSYEETMFRPGDVEQVLQAAVDARSEVPRKRRHAA